MIKAVAENNDLGASITSYEASRRHRDRDEMRELIQEHVSDVASDRVVQIDEVRKIEKEDHAVAGIKPLADLDLARVLIGKARDLVFAELEIKLAVQLLELVPFFAVRCGNVGLKGGNELVIVVEPLEDDLFAADVAVC